MNSFAQWYDKKRGKLWFCVIANLLLLFFVLLIMRPVFDSNDDINIAFFVNRARPIQDPHLLFINSIVGYVCAFLYRLTNMVPWYGILQYFGMFCAFTGMTWVIHQLFSVWSATALSAGLLFFFGADAYVKMQFTKTAGICAACGLLLVVYAMTRKHVHRGALIFGILISVYGYLYRDREAYVMLALWCVFGLILLFRLTEEKRGKRAHKAFSYFACLFLVVLVCLGTWAVNKVSYRFSKDAYAYKELNDVRSDIMDYGFPDYDSNEALYTELGITRNAYQLFSKWNFYDPEVFPLEVQKKILAVQKHKTLSLQTVKDFFDLYPLKWFENPMFYCFLVTLSLVVVFGRRDWKTWLAILLEIAALTGVFFIMYYSGRYNLERVDSPIWLCACLILVFQIDPEKFVLGAREGIALSLILLALCQNTWRENWRNNTEKKEAKRVRSANRVAETSSDTEHFYLSKLGLYSLSTAYGPLDLVPIGAAANTAVLGGWPAGSPSYRAALAKYGMENPYRDVIDNEQVYLADNHIDWTLTYIREYYNDRAQAREVGKLGGDKLYQIYTPQD